MDKKNTVLTPKDIYQMIKEKPYRDGESLIIDYAKSMCVEFYTWENESVSKCPTLSDGFAENTVNDFFNHSLNNVIPVISERDKTIKAVVQLVEQMQEDGISFPDDFIRKLKRVKYSIE